MDAYNPTLGPKSRQSATDALTVTHMHRLEIWTCKTGDNIRDKQYKSNCYSLIFMYFSIDTGEELELGP